MPKKENIVKEPQEPEGDTPEIPEVPVEPTKSEREAQLEAQLQELTRTVEEKEKSYKGLQSVLNTKDAELKKRADIDTRLNGLEETQRMVVAMLDRKLASGEIDESEKVNYLEQFDEIKEKQKRELESAQAKTKQEEYYRKADAVYAEAEKLYGDDVDSLHKIRSLIRGGDFDLAERMIAKATKKETNVEKPKESEEERINRLVEERLAQKMKESPLYQTEELIPAGANASDRQVIKRWAEGDDGVTLDQYLKATGRSAQ